MINSTLKKGYNEITTGDVEEDYSDNANDASKINAFYKEHSGVSYKTMPYLKSRLYHAVLMDSILNEVEEEVFQRLGFSFHQTTAVSRIELLKEPNKGCCINDETEMQMRKYLKHKPDIQIVVTDGLSPEAVNHHAPSVYNYLMYHLKRKGYDVGIPVFMRYGSIGIMNLISEMLMPKVTLLFIGDLTASLTDMSMSCYINQQRIIFDQSKDGLSNDQTAKSVLDTIDHLFTLE